MPTFAARLKHAWNAFNGRDHPYGQTNAMSSSYYPDKKRYRYGNERSIVTAIINRIALDVSANSIRHVLTNHDGVYQETIASGLNRCLTVEANIDQTGRAFIADLVVSMCDEGYIAAVPVDTDVNPNNPNGFDVLTLRRGRILEWRPEEIYTEVYNERIGQKQSIWLPKRSVAILENPFYSIMNEPNSILQRLIRKLNLLDLIDEQSGAGKLDLIIQLPFVIKTETQRREAARRRQEIEDQLRNGKYGIAYTDGTEKVVQLNRPIENNLMKQIEYLQGMLYSQLGITQSVMDGTADERTMLNYTSRSIEPMLDTITDEFKRKFLTSDALEHHQTIKYFRDPFKLTPVADLADIADRMTRNEILSSNEMRAIIGYIPSDDPRANQLVNKNLRAPDERSQNGTPGLLGGQELTATQEENNA